MALSWDPEDRRYRDGGKLLSFNQQARLRDALAELYQRYLAEETALFLAGKLEFASWLANSENYVMQATGNGYAFGRGGVLNMTDQDYDRLARTLNMQVELFQNFAAEVEAGKLSPLQVQARAESYGGSVVYAHEQATNQAAIGDDPDADWDLPFYAGDGETQCLSRCRCSWQIDEDEYGWTCTYHVVSDEGTCEDCNRRGDQHGEGSPLVFPKAGAPARPIPDLVLA